MRYPRIRGLVVAIISAYVAIGCSEATAVSDATATSGPGGGTPTGVSISQFPQSPLCLTNGSSSYVFFASDNLGGGVSWQSRNEAVARIASVDGPNRAQVVGKSAGSTWIVATSLRNYSLKDSVQVVVSADCRSTQPPPPPPGTSSPVTFGNGGPFSLNTGAGCVLQHQIQANQPVNWSSSNTSLATVSGNGTNVGTVNLAPNSSGAVTVTARTLDNVYSNGVTFYLSNATCGGGPNPVLTSLVVSPKNLNLLIGQSGTLFATGITSDGSTMPTPTWVATLGCVQLSSSSGSSVIVTGVRACRDSVVASSGGRQDFAIVTVTSGVNSIIYTPAGGSLLVGSTQQLNATCTLASGANCIPYWYSTKPDRFTVVGAPYVCVIAVVGYPCGPTALIRAIAAGQADVCAQAAVQDPTIRFCSTKTATTSSSAVSPNLIPLELAENEMLMPTAPPPGARVDRIVTFAEWKRMNRR